MGKVISGQLRLKQQRRRRSEVAAPRMFVNREKMRDFEIEALARSKPGGIISVRHMDSMIQFIGPRAFPVWMHVSNRGGKS